MSTLNEGCQITNLEEGRAHTSLTPYTLTESSTTPGTYIIGAQYMFPEQIKLAINESLCTKIVAIHSFAQNQIETCPMPSKREIGGQKSPSQIGK